jgi:hypothetical protein
MKQTAVVASAELKARRMEKVTDDIDDALGDERNATMNYRSVLARELTATDARLYGRTRRQRRSRRSTTDD